MKTKYKFNISMFEIEVDMRALLKSLASGVIAVIPVLIGTFGLVFKVKQPDAGIEYEFLTALLVTPSLFWWANQIRKIFGS